MTILQGNCLDVLRTLPEASVQMCVTSPPYWALRDYKVPPSVWGGQAACEHAWQSAGTKEGYSAKKKWQHSMTNTPASEGQTGEKKRSRLRSDNPNGWTQIEQGKFCTRCGAWLGCLGLEPTPELYIEHLALVFDAVRRVLHPSGTLWLNLGDCYAGGGRGGDSGCSGLEGSLEHQDESKRVKAARPDGLTGKDLVGIPWMAAFALRSRGWILRSDIIWAKTNPMPESTQDRPTKSHEYVFLFAKSENYFYDAHAIREQLSPTTHASGNKARKDRSGFGGPAGTGRHQAHAVPWTPASGGRNRRSVWTISTAPFPGAHFATFPPRLVEPCILAGSSEHGCCSVCGAPFRRLVKKGAPLVEQMAVAGADKAGEYHGTATKAYAGTGAQDPSAVKARILDGMRERITVGWRPTCSHSLREIEPCVVLDPFSGAGTTGMVAAALGREYLGIELGPQYVAMAEQRIAKASA